MVTSVNKRSRQKGVEKVLLPHKNPPMCVCVATYGSYWAKKLAPVGQH